MRKLTILSVMLLGTALIADAQTVKTNFNKGEVSTYKQLTTVTMDLPMGQGRQEVEITNKFTVEVADKTKEGYKIALTYFDKNIKGNESTAEQAMGEAMKYIDGVKVLLKTDNKGVIQGISNYEEVVAAASGTALRKINDIYSKNPNMEKVLPKAKMIMAVSKLLEEDELVKELKANTYFFFYGKKLKTGEKENRTFPQGIKAVSTYTIGENAGNTVISSASVADMNEAEVKAMIMKQMQNMGMGDTSGLESAWGQIKAMGMANLTFNSDAVYTFCPNGALFSSEEKNDITFMGMKMKLIRKTESAK